MLDRFLTTLSIVSRIPVKPRFTFYPSRLDFYLPVTGIFPALIGFLLYAVSSLLAAFTGSPSPAGFKALVVIGILIAQYLAFNLFHLDGLMDTADAFWGSADREKRLAILKDPRVGVYGFFAGAAILSPKAVTLYSLFTFAGKFPALVFAWPVWGRFCAALIPCMAKPLNPDGLGALAKDSRPYRCFTGLAFTLLLWTLLVRGLYAAAPLIGLPVPAIDNTISIAIITVVSLLAVCIVTAYRYARLYTKSLGGYTGDTLGAAIETAEVCCMLVTLALLYSVTPS